MRWRIPLKAIDDDFTEEMRELRALFEEAKREAEKDEPNGQKLRALLHDANEMVRTFTILDPAWQGCRGSPASSACFSRHP